MSVDTTGPAHRLRIDRGRPLMLDAGTGHNRWHPAVPPRLRVAPGEVVAIETRDAYDGQVGPRSRAADLAGLDGTRSQPLTGPVFVEGAEPGDLLEVHVIDVVPQAYGFTTQTPRYGLLKRHFPDPMLVHWALDGRHAVSAELPGIRIPAAPFMGVMGVAPSPAQLAVFREYELALAALGPAPAPCEPRGAIPPEIGADGLRTVPPRDNGGNLDIRQLGPGAVLLLPVTVPGALFSTGDAHFAQGDNECCTGIEMGATLVCRFGLRKHAARIRGIRDAQFSRPAGAEAGRLTEARPYFATTGQSYARDGAPTMNDLNKAAENALLNMVSHIHHEYGFTRQQGCILCSVAADLKISQAANHPNFLVSAVLPLDIFGH